MLWIQEPPSGKNEALALKPWDLSYQYHISGCSTSPLGPWRALTQADPKQPHSFWTACLNICVYTHIFDLVPFMFMSVSLSLSRTTCCLEVCWYYPLAELNVVYIARMVFLHIYIYHIYYICGMCDSLGFYLKTSERRNAPLGAMHWPPGRLQVGCKLQHDSFAPLQYDLAKFKFESRVPGSKFWAHHVNANPTWTQANPMWIVERRKSMQWTKSPKFLRRTPSIREWPSDGVGPKSGDYGQIPYSDGLTVGFCMRSR